MMAIVKFKKLKNYKDSNELLIESNYLQGKEYIQQKNYPYAILKFEELKGYKDSNELLLEAKYLKAIKNINTKEFTSALIDLVELNNYKDSNELLLNLIKENKELKQLYDYIISKEKEKENPKIGMTAEQVKNSKWGNPDKINKTTTAYSVSEQWVYPNYKYIYLDNGVVTAIQE